jgi:very-short-patch-repair endonuclease
MTEAENRLWYHLRDRRLLGFKFVRQYPIARYFADFACREAMLVIEADGGQHTPDRDAIRDATITAAGYKLLRFWNGDILSDTDSVLEEILRALPSTPITKNDE